MLRKCGKRKKPLRFTLPRKRTASLPLKKGGLFAELNVQRRTKFGLGTVYKTLKDKMGPLPWSTYQLVSRISSINSQFPSGSNIAGRNLIHRQICFTGCQVRKGFPHIIKRFPLKAEVKICFAKSWRKTPEDLSSIGCKTPFDDMRNYTFIYLAKFKYFTNLDIPEIRWFPFLSYIFLGSDRVRSL